MNTVGLEILLVLFLSLTNGFLAMSEIALVSARRHLLRKRNEEGDDRSGAALDLAKDPGRSLSTIQIGITLVGVFSGAFSAATISSRLGGWMEGNNLFAPYARSLSLAVVVLAITYLSLVVGELLPKRIALRNPEGIAAAVARPMMLLSSLASPIVRLLTSSTDLLLRLLGFSGRLNRSITEEEIRLLLRQGEEAGTVESVERELVERVFRLADRRVSSVMTPRTEIEWLDIDLPHDELAEKLEASIHACFPVCRGALDEVLGLVRSRDLVPGAIRADSVDLRSALRPVQFIPGSQRGVDALNVFRESRLPFALVMDEYGGLQGLVTVDDILEAVVGEIQELGELPEPKAVEREEGVWILDGLLPVEELPAALLAEPLPGRERALYETVGGFIMMLLERVPEVGEGFSWGGHRFEVLEMEGRRVGRVLVRQEEKK